MNPESLTVVSDSVKECSQHRDRLKDEEYGFHLSLYAAIDLGSNSFHMLVVREWLEASRR